MDEDELEVTDSELLKHASRLCKELDKRGEKHAKIQRYREGTCPVPEAITKAKVTKAYRMLMGMAETSYGKVVVRAAAARMEIGGIRTGDKDLDKKIWSIWQGNHMDSEFRLAQDATITHGRSFAVIEDPKYIELESDDPVITIEDSATVIVEYREGSRYERVAALRRWKDARDIWHITLWRPEGIYKFTARHKSTLAPQVTGLLYARSEEDEAWPIAYAEEDRGRIPVVEIATNRELRSGGFGSACGDLESHLSLFDRIDVLKFLRLVIAFTAGFPVRAVIGADVLEDDEGNPIQPFELAVDTIAQLEDPHAKLAQLDAANIEGFGKAIHEDIEELAGVSMTPTYYLRSVPIQNVNADAIRASDAPLNARTEDHKPQVGEGAEEVMRTYGAMKGLDVPASAEVRWVNREYRSLAERADAATKAKDVLPWQAIAELYFDATDDQIERWQTMKESESLSGLFRPEEEPAAA